MMPQRSDRARWFSDQQQLPVRHAGSLGRRIDRGPPPPFPPKHVLPVRTQLSSANLNDMLVTNDVRTAQLLSPVHPQREYTRSFPLGSAGRLYRNIRRGINRVSL